MTSATLNPLAAGDPESVEVSDDRLERLRKLNIGAGALHLVSALTMTFVASDFTLPITSFNLNGPPGTPVDEGVLSTLADVQLAPLTAGFLYLSAFFHFVIATGSCTPRS